MEEVKYGLKMEQCPNCGEVKECGDVTEGPKVIGRMCQQCYEKDILELMPYKGPKEPDLF